MASKKQNNKKNAVEGVTVGFTKEGWEDFQYWVENNRDIHQRVQTLIESARITPFEGIGKPEPLKGDLTGYWSRRITREDRLVYAFENGVLYVLQCRYHYDE